MTSKSPKAQGKDITRPGLTGSLFEELLGLRCTLPSANRNLQEIHSTFLGIIQRIHEVYPNIFRGKVRAIEGSLA
ncbi:MAG: hypothetical protein IPP82_01860 [Xanthomonadales bacterium]|nr:hypothetical protein [Xanthomonadales bacterium]